MTGMRMFTLYVCPACDEVRIDVSACSHYCKPECGMWVKTRVIEMAAWERKDQDYQRLQFVHDAVVDKAMRVRP